MLSKIASALYGAGMPNFHRCPPFKQEVNDEMVRAHFSRWGTVSDVYFPRHKKTLKRRPFCFVTFASKEDAQRALAESGLEIGGVPIKNLTMVEDRCALQGGGPKLGTPQPRTVCGWRAEQCRSQVLARLQSLSLSPHCRDKYYTNKHASARQALLQALKQLGPQSGGAAAPAPSGAGSVTAEQLSNLAAIMALEGVHSDVVLQTLGLPTSAEAAVAAAAPASSAPMAGLTAASLASLDRSTLSNHLLQALATPSISSQTAFDVRGSLDLSAMRSAGNSLDLSSLQHSLAAVAAAGLPLDTASVGGRMHPTDSRSTLASADWSRAPSARTSLDVLLPAATAGLLGAPPQLGGQGSLGGMHARLSLDAALQLQQAQQVAAAQHAALLANSRLSSSGFPLPPVPPPAPQAALSSVMHSGFYQGGAPPPAPAPAPAHQPEVQHSLQSIMASGLYDGGQAAAHPPTRHSMHEFATGASSLLPFHDATWAPQPGPRHQQQLGGYSTALRPSIDRAGLPPLPPRSPNQGGLPWGSRVDTIGLSPHSAWLACLRYNVHPGDHVPAAVQMACRDSLAPHHQTPCWACLEAHGPSLVTSRHRLGFFASLRANACLHARLAGCGTARLCLARVVWALAPSRHLHGACWLCAFCPSRHPPSHPTQLPARSCMAFKLQCFPRALLQALQECMARSRASPLNRP